jgi:hypothetical protein
LKTWSSRFSETTLDEADCKRATDWLVSLLAASQAIITEHGLFSEQELRDFVF